jgi:hypothetical protein
MELEDGNLFIQGESNKYVEKINELDNGIHLLLDEFKKLYVIVKMNPTNQEYQQQYETTINNVTDILSKLFSISNDVQGNIGDINKKLFEFNILIKQEIKTNNEVKQQLGIIENTSNASYEMIQDYKNIYDKRYLRNWSLLLSSIICIVAIAKIYKNGV